MTRQRAAQEESVDEEEFAGIVAGLRRTSRELAALGTQQSAVAAAQPGNQDPQRAA
ncbi:MAG TPA: hypothetical protein VIX11_17795 [Candidatus Acidoferrum sp.]